MSDYKMSTKCVQGGYTPGNGEPRQIPIIQSTTFKYATSEDMGKLFDLEASGYFYSRLQNPTCDYVAANIPCVKVVRPQASFLLWLDFRKLGLCQKELMDLLLDKAHLALNDGTMFGKEGTGFMRLNVGTPRKVLAEALDHIRMACV